MLDMRRLAFPFAALLAILALDIAPSLAQKGASRDTYTLKKHVREVLTDVTVTDNKGNPVTGLPQSAFHIYDNGHPQTIDSFTPHSGNDLAVTPSSAHAGVYSNSYLSHPPAAYNIALIDVTTMKLNQQMVFRRQLIRFLKTLPPDEPLAIYMRNGPRVVLLQNFTTNRAKLLAAARQAIPRFRPVSFESDTEPALFSQIAVYLSQYPGRKNLLWFNAGSNLFLIADMEELVNKPNGMIGFAGTRDAANGNLLRSNQMRKLYDLLETARIAVYPIDVRGLTTINDLALRREKWLTTKEADSTGGKAYYGTNAVAKSARQIVNQSADFYTITYTPNDLHQLGRWHNVRVQVDGPYHLSYRHGYFDDNFLATHHFKQLNVSNGDTIHAPNFHSNPILFQAKITPTSTSKVPHEPRGTRPYLVRYTLPVAAFPAAPIDTHHYKLTMGVEAAVLDNTGAVRAEKKSLVKLSVPAAAVRAKSHANFTWQQTIELHNGENNILLSVWNPNTGRIGTLQIPIDVKKH